MRILFVCTGNTCRSAMAEGIMKKIINNMKLDISIISRGVYASNDDPATEGAKSALLNLYNIDISEHRAARLTFDDIKNSDFIYVMTENHKNLILTTLEDDNLSKKIKNLCENDINDPYMGSKKDYEACAKELYKEIIKITEGLLNEEVMG